MAQSSTYRYMALTVEAVAKSKESIHSSYGYSLILHRDHVQHVIPYELLLILCELRLYLYAHS